MLLQVQHQSIMGTPLSLHSSLVFGKSSTSSCALEGLFVRRVSYEEIRLLQTNQV